MNKTESFAGFPEGKLPLTPIPNAFFSELLPRIDHLGEFKVTIYAFWALTQKEGHFRYISLEEMAADQLLMEGLKLENMTPLETLVDALERAVARGTFLKVKVEFDQGEDSYFFLNSPKGRAAVASIEAGDWQPTGESRNAYRSSTRTAQHLYSLRAEHRPVDSDDSRASPRGGKRVPA